MASGYHKTGPPTSPPSSPPTRSQASVHSTACRLLHASQAFPLIQVARPALSSCPALRPPHGNPSHPSRPSSNVISSVKALLISPTGCVFFLLSTSSDSTFFVHQGTFLTLQPFVSFLCPCDLSLSSYEILKSLEAKTILLDCLQLLVEPITLSIQ